eukprot:2209978-Lingulodinium_polyedra.AAC.1
MPPGIQCVRRSNGVGGQMGERELGKTSSGRLCPATVPPSASKLSLTKRGVDAVSPTGPSREKKSLHMFTRVLNVRERR